MTRQARPGGRNQDEQPQSRFWRLWTTEPRALVAITAFVVAITGLIALVWPRENAAPVTTASTGIAPTTAPVPTSGPQASEPTSTTDAPVGTVRWQERVRLPRRIGIDLDADRPLLPPPASGFRPDFQNWTFSSPTETRFDSAGHDRIGRAPEPDPSFASCREAVETARVDGFFSIARGQGVCVITDGDSPHLAFIKLISFDENGDVTLDIRVWEEPP